MIVMYIKRILLLCLVLINLSGYTFSQRESKLHCIEGYLSLQDAINDKPSCKYQLFIDKNGRKDIVKLGDCGHKAIKAVEVNKKFIRDSLAAIRYDSALYLNCGMIIPDGSERFVKAETQGRYIFMLLPLILDKQTAEKLGVNYNKQMSSEDALGIGFAAGFLGGLIGGLIIVGVVSAIGPGGSRICVIYDTNSNDVKYFSQELFMTYLSIYSELRSKYVGCLVFKMTKSEMIDFVNDLNSAAVGMFKISDDK